MISHIETKMKLGYCPKCYTWLGYNTENYPKRISESDQWVIKTIEDWIISTSQLTVSPENSCIKKLISSYVHSNYDESFTGLAAKIGISRANLGLLTYRGDKIRLSVALNICKYFEIPLSQLLNERYEQELTEGMKKGHFMDMDLIEKRLLKILTKENPPLSLNKTAKELGYWPKTLSKYFPSICSKIVKRYEDNVIEIGKYYPGEAFSYFKTGRHKPDANNSPN